MKSSVKKLLGMALALVLVLCLLTGSASACTSIYVGSALTADGSTFFGRSEDMSNSMNKLFDAIPAGVHKAGEVYQGCYGFTWTFTHDSYAYTAFTDDNGPGVDGVCPDCGDTHPHTPYQAAGTNEFGVSVTATESLRASKEIRAVEPNEDEGIEEAELTTILLSEAASVQEALALYTGILDASGCNSGSGIFIGDNTETWYIENLSGHQYIAVKLSAGMVMVQPNMCVIGLIDLDDTENVIYSPALIATAKEAGTFVGDEEANTINFNQSYTGGSKANARMVNALNDLDPAFAGADADAIDPAAAYLISNVDADGSIVPMHTGITLPKAFTVEDVQAFYHIDQIGKAGNLETHVFQTFPEDGLTDTVEWIAMNDAQYSVFIPYYPMLTTAVEETYKLSTPKAAFSEEKPESGVYYASAKSARDAAGNRITVNGYKILPENWADSFYWAYDALSNTILYNGLAEDQIAAANDALNAKQAEINADFEALKAQIAAADDAAALATAWSMEKAQEVQQLAVTLVNGWIAQ